MFRQTQEKEDPSDQVICRASTKRHNRRLEFKYNFLTELACARVNCFHRFDTSDVTLDSRFATS